MKSNNIKIAISIFAIIALTGFLFIWFGLFNVAANEKHWDITTDFLEVIRERSIRSHAKEVTMPDLTNQKRIAKGAANYAAMCAQCHLAPGVDTSELYEGLYPQPPVLFKRDKLTRDPKETFWIIKNGLKMTGMPAWEIYNSDDQIWDLIALIPALKDMSPQEYQKLVDAGKHTHEKGGHNNSGHTDGNDSSQKKMKHIDDHHAPVEKTKSNHNHDGHKH